MDLLREWTGRTIRARYQQSALGWLWALLQPCVSVATFTLIFTVFVPVDTADTPYVVFAYTAFVPWTLLAASLNDMTGSLVQNMNLVSKVYFRREVLPIAAMLARLMDFCVAGALMAVLMVYFQIPLFPMGWLLLPVILAVQLMLVVGVGLACAALNVFYRDVQSLLTLSLQIWFYASPIIYPVSVVPERFRDVYFLNPMAGILEAYRAVLLRGEVPGPYLILSGLVSGFALVVGYTFFKKVEDQFADLI